MESRLQTQPQYARARNSSNLIIRSLADIPRAEKLVLTGLSASFVVACMATPAGGAVLALAAVSTYFGLWKPNQDKLVKEYFNSGLSHYNVFHPPRRLLEISNEISTFTGDSNAYPALGPEQGYALHNACVSQIF